jgi:L-threonylcarbamoyladenylate synthase
MKVVKAGNKAVKLAAKMVLNGGVIVYPTDTVYGIGCDPTNKKAVRRLIEIKGRESKPMPVLFSNIKSALNSVRLSKQGVMLARKFWPGALTIVGIKKNENIVDEVTAGSNLLGVRVPKNNIIVRIMELSLGMIVGTSANKSGMPSPKSADEVLKYLPNEYDLLIDGGLTLLQKESTVVDASTTKVKVLREGCIKKEEVVAALGSGW